MQNHPGALTAALVLALGLLAATAWGADSKVYMSDLCGDSIYIADPVAMDTWGTINIGRDPERLVASADRRYVFVAVHGEDKVQVIDTGVDKVAGSIKVGKAPGAMALTPDGKTLLVCNEGDMTVSVIDADSLKETRRLKLSGYPVDIKVSPDGGKAYVIASGMEIIDLGKMEVSPWPDFQKEVSLVEISHSGRQLYVYTSDEYKEIVVLDTASMKPLTTIKGGYGMKMSPDGKELWYLGPDNNTLNVYSTADNKVVATLPRGSDNTSSCEIEFSTDGKTVFVSNVEEKEDLVAVFDTASRKKTGELKAPPCVGGILYLAK
jgi:YVTN family beta-propeller protein